MKFFRYNIVVAAYPVFVYVVSRAGRQYSDIQLVHLLVVWYLVNLQDARCNNKEEELVYHTRCSCQVQWVLMKSTQYYYVGFLAVMLWHLN